MNNAIAYIVSLLSLIVLDALWLGIIAKGFFKNHIGNLLRPDFMWPAIILFYLLYAAAIIYFVVLPAQGEWTKALIAGALLGCTAYMTYDLVNFATLKQWPLAVVIVDIAWGTCMTAIAGVVATILSR